MGAPLLFGILMERFDLGPDRAFATLTRLSQARNVKLRGIAERIAHTRNREISVLKGSAEHHLQTSVM